MADWIFILHPAFIIFPYTIQGGEHVLISPSVFPITQVKIRDTNWRIFGLELLAPC